MNPESSASVLCDVTDYFRGTSPSLGEEAVCLPGLWDELLSDETRQVSFDQTHFKDQRHVEGTREGRDRKLRREWDPTNSELDLSSHQPQDATSEKSLLSKRAAEIIYHVEPTPTIPALDHSPAPGGQTPERLESEDEQPLENPSVEPRPYQGPHRPKKKANCPTCGKVFPHNSGLRRHLVIHSGKKPYKCFICGRGFTQSGNLKTHMKVHKGEVKIWSLVRETPPKAAPVTVHVCAECGMEFPQKQQLEEHRDTHKKPYACPDCTKTFKDKYYLKQHMRSHAVEPTFLCSECGKSCISAGSLRKHELTHTGEKNFQCVQCGRTFAQSSHLNVHLKTHTGERPHLCSICGKSYARASALKVHLRVHTGEKPYTCDKCGKCFHYDQGYRKHLKNHNKKPKPPTKPLGRPKQQPLVRAHCKCNIVIKAVAPDCKHDRGGRSLGVEGPGWFTVPCHSKASALLKCP
ncbi:unnamed protein product [Pleuronectes platessa]|uniref:C2H2-type domain-containing protein n=1 Tax=Pleuronectes platessa TaxID=8262 RepID=A0A9N7Z8D8_PLEPL|nr:unnamed protein product [Pleuronectes platessa]